MELAALMPVVLVVALILMNLGVYLERCARFDRVALDMALAHGVSPEGEQDAENACAQVCSAIVEAMGEPFVEVTVEAERLDPAEVGALFALSPSRVRFVCSMAYAPVPQGFSIAGVSLGAPLRLRHERSVVVDAGSIGLGVR